MKITFLTEEWTQSTKGSCSTFMRQMAIELSRLENVEIGILIPSASPKDKVDAEKYNIKVFEPENYPGFDLVDCLQFPPQGFSTDFIIGHGIKPGCHGQVLKNKLSCKWVHVVLRNAEEIAVFKETPDAFPEGQKQHETEVKLCKNADVVLTVGSKLNETFKPALHQYKKDHIFNLIPGIFDEFFGEQKQYRNPKNFEILVFVILHNRELSHTRRYGVLLCLWGTEHSLNKSIRGWGFDVAAPEWWLIFEERIQCVRKNIRHLPLKIKLSDIFIPLGKLVIEEFP